MQRLIAISVMGAVLAACSSHPGATAMTSSATPAPAVTNALAGTPLAAYGHDLNKAKDVQSIVNAAGRKEAKAIDAATGSSSGN